MSDSLLCGAAKRDITPDKDKLDGLFGLMAVPYADVLDTIYLRVLAFSDGVQRAMIIAFDLDKAPNPVTWLSALSEHTGIPEENITYIGTHTHSAPLTTIRPKEKVRKEITERHRAAMKKYEDMVFEKLFSCVDEALSSMQPARMGYGKGESYISVNRNADFQYEDQSGEVFPVISQGHNAKGYVDHTVFVFKVESKEGRPIAFFINYPVHCCTMFLNNCDGKGSMGISGDIAGNVSRLMEEKFPGSVAVWSSGAAGNVNPVIGNEVFYPNPLNGMVEKCMFPDAKTIYSIMMSLVYSHFADILQVVRNITETSGQVKIGGAIAWSETPSYEMETLESGEMNIVGESEKPYRIRMHLLRLGDISLLGIGGELYNTLGKMLIDHATLSNTVVLNHDASLIDDAGYILDDDTLARVRRKTAIKGSVPGYQFTAKEGCIEPSLLKQSADMFRSVL